MMSQSLPRSKAKVLPRLRCDRQLRECELVVIMHGRTAGYCWVRDTGIVCPSFLRRVLFRRAAAPRPLSTWERLCRQKVRTGAVTTWLLHAIHMTVVTC